PLQFLEAMGRRLRHVHVLDYDAQGRRALPGRGCYDFRALADALKAISYQGDVILEPYGYMTNDESELRRSLRYLREVFEAKG
ncbi:MAG TPA: TIM barrel protein, partial [Clostridia bacterium]|nr:TIM barrel protein [Clostridia bacterium]